MTALAIAALILFFFTLFQYLKLESKVNKQNLDVIYFRQSFLLFIVENRDKFTTEQYSRLLELISMVDIVL